MRPIPDSSLNNTSPLTTRPKYGTGPQPPQSDSQQGNDPPRLAAQTDRLQTNPDLVPMEQPDPHSLFQKVKQLREDGDSHPVYDGLKQEYDDKGKPAFLQARQDVKSAMQSPQTKKAEHKAAEAGGFLAFMGNVWNAIGGTPMTLIGNIQGAFFSSHTVVKGAHTLNTARKGEGILSWLRGTARDGWNTFKGDKWGTVKKLVGIGGPKPAVVAGGKGFVGFYGEARAGGSSILKSLGKAFGNTVDKGGSMPKIAEEAAQMGGNLGKVAVWAGRLGRVAPLLNVPIAVFDVKKAWDVWHDPKSTTLDKVSSTGTAALGTAAAGLAVAGFLTPPPIDAALFAAAGVTGLASMVWGAVTSKGFINFAQNAGKDIASGAKAVGNAVTGAAKSVGHALSGAANSVAHFFGF